MSGALSMLMASGSGGPGSGTFSVTVGLGTNTNGIGVTVNYVYGYAVVGTAPGAGFVFNTQFVDNNQCDLGSVTSPATSVTVIGIYSAGGTSGNASYYMVLTNGNTTVSAPNFATTLTIDGTTVSGTRTVQYVGSTLTGAGASRPCTQYLFTLGAPAATLFGTTAGAIKNVVIT